jgi:hypothetical protein
VSRVSRLLPVGREMCLGRHLGVDPSLLALEGRHVDRIGKRVLSSFVDEAADERTEGRSPVPDEPGHRRVALHAGLESVPLVTVDRLQLGAVHTMPREPPHG